MRTNTGVTGAEAETQGASEVFDPNKRLFDEESPILASNMRAVKKTVS